jgi:ParB family chromosome partitioning protein
LVDTIKAEGMNQPVLVRERMGGGFEIVDGGHRWKAARMAGLKRIAVVLVKLDNTKAKVRAISFNHMRGQAVPIKLARLIVDLQKEYIDAEIKRMTGISNRHREGATGHVEGCSGCPGAR